MPSTLSSLLHRSLDFAGLFPPASLTVPEALRQFRHEQAANTAGMLSRFVCPVLRLEEVAAAAGDGQLVVAALPRGGRNAGEFLANLESDFAAIRRLTQLHENTLTIDTIELRPPADALPPPALRKLLSAINALLGRQTGLVRQVFIELAPSPILASHLELLAEQAALLAGTTETVFGYKLRTGGSDTTASPSAAQTAAALAAAAALGIPMKCTGGLHRPLRTLANGTSAAQHGFINLLFAATLATTAHAEPGVLESVLEETDPAAFAFDSRNLSWRDRKFTPSAVTTARRRILLSFGSCYAEQPRLELQKLGWWPKPVQPRVARVL